jgi:hypothetical protein
MALEGPWHATSIDHFLSQKRQDPKWTLFIMLPDVVTNKDVAKTMQEAARKCKLPGSAALRLHRFKEEEATQVMHLGLYSDERATIDRLHAFIAEKGYRPRESHYEFYMGDPRRSKPEKLKTILRQPVQRAPRK